MVSGVGFERRFGLMREGKVGPWAHARCLFTLTTQCIFNFISCAFLFYSFLRRCLLLSFQVVQVLKGGAQCGKMVKGRSKEKADGAGDLAAKMRWLQEQAAKRLAG